MRWACASSRSGPRWRWAPFEQFIYRSAAEREGRDDARSIAGDLDLTIYSLRTWMRLALKGNPTILLLLFTPDDQLVHCDSLGSELRALTPAIISRRNAAGQDPSPEPGTDLLLNLLVERQLRAAALPTKYIGYVDMLGFGALVRAHPGAFNVDVDESTSAVSTSTSKSSERFDRFHAVLDRIAMNAADASRPERMMVFSDCAFALYDNALQAAVSLCEAMRRFLAWAVPVRMCIAKGTCHAERFSIESFPTFNLTRSMFYGSGIVFAVQGEENAGKDCRIFLSTSLDAEIGRRLKAA